MQSIRSGLFSLIFYPATFLFVVLGIAAGAISTPAMLKTVYGWSHFNHWLAKNLLGIRVEIEGAMPPGPHLIAVSPAVFERSK